MEEQSRPKQGAAVLKALEGTEARRDEAQRLWLRMCEADNGALFPVDLVAGGAVKRLVSHSSAFRLLVDSWNLVCARAMLRMQIDTALRFSAFWLVDQPHDFASQIIKRRRIDRMKDRNGHLMRDAYLISKLELEHSWLREVYENTSGYIHFSGDHLTSSFEKLHKENRELHIEISEFDDNYPESTWLEVIDYFNKATDIFLYYLIGWIKTKEAGTKN